MKRVTIKFILILSLFAPKLWAWNALGHEVVALIAYQHLTPEARNQVDLAVSKMHQEYPDINSYAQIASWPDALRSQKIDTFTRWHYIDTPFSTDGTPLRNSIDTDNAVWVLDQIEVVVGNKEANPFERARFIAFLTHIAGDIHQPMHTVSRFSANHSLGDRGGNDYFIKFKGQEINMHKFWDEGAGEFMGSFAPDHAAKLATQIEEQYPESYFGNKTSVSAPDAWAAEGVTFAKANVYIAPENEPLTEDYIDQSKQRAMQQAALAGYRLANVLNKLLG